MTTSGTVATTTIDNSALIEHALRRVKVLPSAQTPEVVLIAKECLYMLLLNLGNRGLNLWAVEKAYMGLEAGKALYTTPPGTLDILNCIFVQPTFADTVFSPTAVGGTAFSSVPEAGVRVGVKFSSDYTGALSLGVSDDGVVYETVTSVPANSYYPNQYYWFDLDKSSSKSYYTVSGFIPLPVVVDIKVVTKSYDLPMTQWNRDTYSAINSKSQISRPSVSYFFEKKLTPTLTLWPVPSTDTDHLMVFRHRQPQDVGSLVQQLEIPQRWLDGIIWLLAARLCFELPTVDPATAQMVVQMADKQVFEAEQSETDGAPMYLTPNIRVYNR